MYIIAHFSFQFLKIFRSSEDERHKGGEGRQKARAEAGAEAGVEADEKQ